MRRFTVLKLMILVALLGANIAAVREIFGLFMVHQDERRIAGGFLPLLNAIVIALLVAAFAGRKDWALRGRRALIFAVISSLVLIMGCSLSYAFPWYLKNYLHLFVERLDLLLRPFGLMDEPVSNIHLYIIAPIFLGILISGPAMALSLVLTWLLNWVLPGRGEPCDASVSAV